MAARAARRVTMAIALLAAALGVAVSAGVPAAAVAAPVTDLAGVTGGSSHTCAWTQAGEAWCWGSNAAGQLGDGTFEERLLPTPVKTAGTALSGRTVVDMDAGATHTCAVLDDGSVACWGEVGFHRITGTSADTPDPTRIATTGSPFDGADFVRVTVGQYHACAQTDDGRVACWGHGSGGRLGNGASSSSTAPVAVSTAGVLAGVQAQDVDAGFGHTCARTSAGGLACWGDNSYGQLGDGTTVGTTSPVAVSTAGTPLDGRTVTAVDVGNYFSCATGSGDALACWGQNSSRQLGNDSTGTQTKPVAVVRAGSPLAATTVAEIEVDGWRACARTPQGAVACWGSNGSGTAGIGDASSSGIGHPTAVAIAGTVLADGPAVGLGGGVSHACARTAAALACWGQNGRGQLGNGEVGFARSPAAVAVGDLVGRTVTSVEVGSQTACARSTDGTVACWGSNSTGLVATGSLEPVVINEPRLITPGSALAGKSLTAVDLADGKACAVASDSTVACWGVFAPTPSAVSLVGTPLAGKVIADLDTGAGHSCLLATDGTMGCWGDNGEGELGVDPAVQGSSSKPVAPTTAGTPLAGKAIASISAGWDVTCAVATDGTGACWGDSTFGQLGRGTFVGDWHPAAPTMAGTALAGKQFSEIATEGFTTCARTTDSVLACWGSNSVGKLGAAFAEDRSNTPVAVVVGGGPLAGKSVVDIEVGYSNVCARTADHVVACWGGNSSGQLGDGTTSPRDQPTLLATVGTPLAGQALSGVAAATSNICLSTVAGKVACTGDDLAATLGDGDPGFETRPATVLGAMAPASDPPDPPGAPTAVTATASDGSATVTWTAPTSTGGSPITGYLVTPYKDLVARTPVPVAGTGLSKVVTGLTNGSTYTFTVAATNAAGTGPQSVASNAVTPRAPFSPFPSWTAFVARQYTDITGAPPSSSQSSTWVTALAVGSKTKGELVESLRRGTENLTNVDPTARLYRAFLGRSPDPSGLEFWIGRRRTGAWSLARMADYFAASSEFKTKYGTLTNRQFVTRIYTDVLGRPADQAGVNFWTTQLDTKKRTRGTVMIGFSESTEYKRKQAENTDVAVAHILLLGRAPTAAEITAWTTRQKAGATLATLAGELLDSDGYRIHAAAP